VAGTSSPARLAERLRTTRGNGAALADVQQIICVTDALDYLHTSAGPSALLDFQNDLVAGATLVVLNKCDLLDEPQLALCLDRLRTFHPEARVAQTAYGEVPSHLWARSASGDEIAEAIERRKRPFPLEMPPFGATMYRAYRPFHPQRFFEWFRVEHAGLERVKGIAWLATRSLLVGGISRTRRQSSAGAAGIWWAALPREDWPEDEPSLRAMQATWREPYGDRRQELVLLGEAERLTPAIHKLNACLLRDAEFALPLREWSTFPDPFPEWDLE
jgi:G3E family GTPase